MLGLVGTNGIGKSTALKILSGKVGKLTPNLGDSENPPDWKTIIKYFAGSELQSFFQKMLDEDMKAVIKKQFVEEWKKSGYA